MTRFTDWKAKVTKKLIDIAEAYSANEKFVQQVENLLVRLRNAKRRDIAVILNDVYLMYRYWKVRELLDIIPSEQELHELLVERGDED